MSLYIIKNKYTFYGILIFHLRILINCVRMQVMYILIKNYIPGISLNQTNTFNERAF